MGEYLPDPTDRDHPWAAPARAPSVAGLAPTVVVTAEFDVLRDEGRAYGARLRREGIPVVHHEYPGAIHGFFWIGGRLDDCQTMLEDLAEDLGRLWDGPAAFARTP